MKPNQKKRGLLSVVMFLMIISSLCAQYNNVDTLYPIDQITPFEITGNPAINIPLTHANPIGDINGDGFTDFAFTDWTADERTDNPNDMVLKTVLIMDIDQPDSAMVLYEKRLSGIGDINGDGYDDLLNIRLKSIFYGGPEGLSGDSTVLDFGNNYEDLFYVDDINKDGKSEFIIGSSYGDTLLVYSEIEDIIQAVIMLPKGSPCKKRSTTFTSCDYDNDGIKDELMIANNLMETYADVEWFSMDATSQMMISEYRKVFYPVNLQRMFYSGVFSDLNADGLVDLIYTYRDVEDFEFNLEVLFGIPEEPYFESGHTFEIGNSNPFIYHAGDINIDGCGDFYIKQHEDSITVFYANEDIISSGFHKETYFTGTDQLFMLKTKYPWITYYSERFPVFHYNDDSIADMIIDYWKFDNNMQYEHIGTAIVKGGNQIDFSNPRLITQPREQSYQELFFGHQMKNLGDINNDGFEDWGTLAKSGCYAEIYWGGTNSDNHPDMHILLPQKGFSRCLDWDAGDINNDGQTDFIIANSAYSEIHLIRSMIDYRNRVFVFLGKENMPAVLNYQDADFVLSDTSVFYQFGENITIVNDYNDDGYNDFVIGGRKHRDCLREAFVYFGGELISPTPDMILSVPCSDCGIRFSDPITSCGDINNDGYDDFILGDPDNFMGQSLVYFGGPNADEHYDIALKAPNNIGRNFGRFTAREQGDYDEDGYPDLIYYFSDTVFMFRGGPVFDTMPDMTFSDTNFTHSVSFIDYLDDFSINGKSDIILGNYHDGNMFVFSSKEDHNQSADLFIKNDNTRSSGICSGFFNDNVFVDLKAGVPSEPNYGRLYGGIIQCYESPNPTEIRDDHSYHPDLISVYPNPASDYLYITGYHQFVNGLCYQIYSSDGTEVLTGKQIPIPVKSLPTGLYYIIIKDGKKMLQTRKFAKGF